MRVDDCPCSIDGAGHLVIHELCAKREHTMLSALRVLTSMRRPVESHPYYLYHPGPPVRGVWVGFRKVECDELRRLYSSVGIEVQCCARCDHADYDHHGFDSEDGRDLQMGDVLLLTAKGPSVRAFICCAVSKAWDAFNERYRLNSSGPLLGAVEQLP